MVQNEIFKNLINQILNWQPIKDFIDGIVLLSKSIGYFVFLPLKILGLQPVSWVVQVIYIAIMVYILYKLSSSWKFALALSVGLIIFGSIG